MADLPRMRFAKEAVQELKQLDPNSCVSESFIRSLMKRGLIPYVEVGGGKRRLLNFDALIAFLENPQPSPSEPARAGGIRRIN